MVPGTISAEAGMVPRHRDQRTIHRATHWWQAAEVVRVFPNSEAATDFLSWLQVHGLGRKRLLDTLLAATFHHAGIGRIITNNERDYRAFGVFELIGYRE